MNDYKLVPVEPTAEMVEVYQKASSWTAPLSSRGYKAMLRAAPAVQREPAAWMVTWIRTEFDKPLKALHSAQLLADEQQRHWEGRGGLVYQTPLYAATQPAEQQPAPALSKFLEKEEWNDAFAQGFNAGFNSDENPSPDITQLVEALEWIRKAINCTPENDKQKCGAWISSSHPWIKRIDALIAAHRQGGDHV